MTRCKRTTNDGYRCSRDCSSRRAKYCWQHKRSGQRGGGRMKLACKSNFVRSQSTCKDMDTGHEELCLHPKIKGIVEESDYDIYKCSVNDSYQNCNYLKTLKGSDPYVMYKTVTNVCNFPGLPKEKASTLKEAMKDDNVEMVKTLLKKGSIPDYLDVVRYAIAARTKDKKEIVYQIIINDKILSEGQQRHFGNLSDTDKKEFLRIFKDDPEKTANIKITMLIYDDPIPATGDKSVTSVSDISKKSKKDTAGSFTLMTFNVQNYETANVDKIHQFIESIGADIVCLQEDNSNMIKKHDNLSSYEVKSYCLAEFEVWKWGGHLTNTILVKKELAPFVESLVQNNKDYIYEYCPKERCAATIKLNNGIVISNLHLCGGRFDDPNYQGLTKEKDYSIRKLINKYHPDIILGDFNGEKNPQMAKNRLITHPIYNKLTNESRKQQFLEYYTSGHKVLENNKYQDTYQGDYDKLITSKFGGLPDWIYINPNKVSFKNTVIHNTLHLSDHNAVTTTIISQGTLFPDVPISESSDTVKELEKVSTELGDIIRDQGTLGNQSARYYKATGYVSINKELRSRKNLTADYQDVLKNPDISNDYHQGVLVNEFILKNPIKVDQPIIAYRGIKLNTTPYKKGDLIPADGIWSATISPKIAFKFYELNREGMCCLLKINIPVGFPVVHLIDPTNDWDVQEEDELILPYYFNGKLVKYRVKNVQKETVKYIPYNYDYYRHRVKTEYKDNPIALKQLGEKYDAAKAKAKNISVVLVELEPELEFSVKPVVADKKDKLGVFFGDRDFTFLYDHINDVYWISGQKDYESYGEMLPVFADNWIKYSRKEIQRQPFDENREYEPYNLFEIYRILDQDHKKAKDSDRKFFSKLNKDARHVMMYLTDFVGAHANHVLKPILKEKIKIGDPKVFASVNGLIKDDKYRPDDLGRKIDLIQNVFNAIEYNKVYYPQKEQLSPYSYTNDEKNQMIEQVYQSLLGNLKEVLSHEEVKDLVKDLNTAGILEKGSIHRWMRYRDDRPTHQVINEIRERFDKANSMIIIHLLKINGIF